ncbi:MAG: Endo,4-beta-xylanase [Verrucomicrobiales bacterium]|nr:Endo,4-beta-xylanase [Verrucomicrobiales bacterium]
MKFWRFAQSIIFGLLLLPAALRAQPTEIPLWPNGAPGSEGKKAAEVVERGKNGERSVFQVHNPSIAPYLPPRAKATGAAVIVIPGGGHRVLAIEHEGYNVGLWLSEHGIAAFVLKYRLARETNSTYKVEVEALADTQRAVRMVRSRAQEWGIDPASVGVMGFSAGGELAALACMRFDNGIQSATDAVEKQSDKPNFQALIYPGNSRIISPVKESPPAFLVCGYNDRPDISEGLATVYLKFKTAGVPADLHIYSNTGHGFGLRANNQKPSGNWIVRFDEWLADSGFLRKQ